VIAYDFKVAVDPWVGAKDFIAVYYDRQLKEDQHEMFFAESYEDLISTINKNAFGREFIELYERIPVYALVREVDEKPKKGSAKK